MSSELGKSADPESLYLIVSKKSSMKCDELKGFQKRIEKFAKDLKMFEENSKYSFHNAILFGAYHALLDNKKIFELDQSRHAEVFGKFFFWRAPGKKNFATRLRPFKFSSAVSSQQ